MERPHHHGITFVQHTMQLMTIVELDGALAPSAIEFLRLFRTALVIVVRSGAAHTIKYRKHYQCLGCCYEFGLVMARDPYS